MFLVVLFVISVSGESEPTPTKAYDLEVPGSDPIRIIESEPLWHSTPFTSFEQRAFDEKNHDSENPLHQFFTTYAETVRKNNISNRNKEQYQMESMELITKPNEAATNRLANVDMNDSERSKSWDMMNYKKFNHPYDEIKGWVSMDPVPWSVSKVSKWESKYKPNSKPWDGDYDNMESPTTHSRPSWNKPTNNYNLYYVDHDSTSNKPIFMKPTAVHDQKIHVDYNKKYHKHDENCRHHTVNDDGDIITDGLPANFPQQYEANRRKSTEVFPDTHPFSGDGDWVLLSTTKGYKYPQHRQRALQINPESIGAHRGVRLTVLPPLKNSKVNMTTSHGGLLQVESTFQTVEQAHKQYAKKKLNKKRPQINRPVRQKLIAPTLTTTKRNIQPDSSAVLAAVGAGMIPATMAMLVPMALGRRRKRRDTNYVTITPDLQLTLPRNLY